MSKPIFTIIDKSKRKIHLSKERWSHITLHKYMASKLEDIKRALANPDLIVTNKFDYTRKNYYLNYKKKNRYLLVGVKYLNGKGFVTTSFITRKLIKR